MQSYLKNKKSLLVLVIIGLVLVVIGTTYAFFSYAKNGSKEHTIKTGGITFHYEESNRGITLENSLPMTDAQGKAQSEYFDFRITSKSDFAEIPYVISAVTSSNSTLDSSVVKVYLTEINNGVETQILLDKYSNLTSKVFVGSKNEKVMHRDIATVTGSEYEKNYRLRIWISDDIEWLVQENGVDTYPYQNKTLTLTVNVYTNEGNSLTENNITTPDDTRVKMVSMNSKYLLEESSETGVDYEVNVPNEETTGIFNITTNNIAATTEVTSLGNTLSYNEDGVIKRLSASSTYNLLTENNYYKVRVTSADTTDYKDYILKVNREKSKDNSLMYLGVEGYEFQEEFSNDRLEYNLSLEATSVNIVANKTSEVASVVGDGVKQLEWGLNTYKVKVTAEDGSEKEFTIKINNVRPTAPVITGGSDEYTSGSRTISVLSPGTAVSDVLNYEYYVSENSSTPSNDVTVTGTTNGTQEVTTNGIYYVFYRSVSKSGNRSVWSSPQVVKIDKTEYTITYNLNSGSLASGATNPTTYKVDTNTFILNNPSKTNYTFTGWSGTGLTGNTNKEVTIVKGSQGNKEYTANFLGIQKTVTLNNQGASSAGSTSVTGTYGSNMPNITKPTKTFTVTYNYNGNGTANTTATSTYTFGGYYTETGGNGTQYYTNAGASARTWDKTVDTTLYAKWTGGSVTLPTPTRTNYVFLGWYTTSTGGTKVGVGGASYSPTANITLYAVWGPITTFSYNGTNNTDGSVQTFTASRAGTYQIEVWGAAGGNANGTSGGKGGYAKGNKKLTANQKLYVAVGGQGISNATSIASGGYNGGGACGTNNATHYQGSGGGATSVTTTNRGVLSNFASYKSEVVIVAGGGGGADYWNDPSGPYGVQTGAGGAGGGTTGGNGTTCCHTVGKGGSQTAGGTGGGSASGFGYGGAGYSAQPGGGGGGGGYYGGGGARDNAGGGGGSGYTGGVTNASMKNGERSGHGYVKITLISID